MLIRVSKAVLVLCAGVYASLVAVNNIADYGTNFEFVRHTLNMDTTFPGSKLNWRALDSSTLHHLFYAAIIVAEGLTGLLCVVGAQRLWRARADGNEFRRAKGLAVAGLTVGIVLWFGGFIAIGGEWFLMWQSETWNGLDTAFRTSALMTLVLIYLTAASDDTPVSWRQDAALQEDRPPKRRAKRPRKSPTTR